MAGLKKRIYTLIVDNYAPDITSLTLPLMKKYADKIGADFYVIGDRKFTGPPVLEKFQIYQLAHDLSPVDWHVFFDADTLIHPDMWDVTVLLHKDTTASYGSDFVPIRFKPDQYFLRDGRFIGKGNWCLIASDWCVDIWQPLSDITVDEAVRRITPTMDEQYSGVFDPSHLIDDYIVSRNISRYGLKHTLITQLAAQHNIPAGPMWHQYLPDKTDVQAVLAGQLPDWKLQYTVNVLKQWDLTVSNGKIYSCISGREV